MPTDPSYLPGYGHSRALVIGINEYRHLSPLGNAVQDAEGMVERLESTFGFPSDNISLLLDENATRHKIMSSFLRFAESDVGRDDRIVVFFAGHGLTRPGLRGEVGFLVPVDGDTDDLSSLIRWDDLTRNAELIIAKHVLFMMDACYGD